MYICNNHINIYFGLSLFILRLYYYEGILIYIYIFKVCGWLKSRIPVVLILSDLFDIP